MEYLFYKVIQGSYIEEDTGIKNIFFSPIKPEINVEENTGLLNISNEALELVLSTLKTKINFPSPDTTNVGFYKSSTDVLTQQNKLSVEGGG